MENFLLNTIFQKNKNLYIRLYDKKKKFLFVVNSFKFFKSHRLPIANKLYNLGYEIHLICNVDDKIKSEDSNILSIHNLRLTNIKRNPFVLIKTLIMFRFLVKRINPSKIHFITIFPIFIASIYRNYLSKFKIVISFSGLGYFAINKNFTTFFFNMIFYFFLRKLYKNKNLYVIYQNNDDLDFINNKIKFKNYRYNIIKGSGVDLKRLSFTPIIFKNNIITFTLISRLLKDKGIYEFFKATNLIRSQKLRSNFKIVFNLIGDFDFNNPTSLKKNDVDIWSSMTDNNYLGYKSNIKKYLINSDVIILPSYREGMPKILLEASSIGRAIIATDVPGCRDCVINNYNGKLVKVRSASSIFEAIQYFIENIEKIKEMGFNSRKIAEKDYSIEDVITKHIEIYES